MVMAIIVMIISLAVPALQRTLRSYRLRKSADIVKGEWARARNRAIQTGDIQVFRCTPNSGQFRIDSWVSEFSMDPATMQSQVAGQQGALALPPSSNGFEQLPEDVMFTTAQVALDSRALTVEQELGTGASSFGGGEQRIYFYPDGTTSTARLIINNSHDQYVVIDLRGLTGIAKSSGLLGPEELPQ